MQNSRQAIDGTSTPDSSLNSRTMERSGVSPGSTAPPRPIEQAGVENRLSLADQGDLAVVVAEEEAAVR